jgi:hypothetical protein
VLLKTGHLNRESRFGEVGGCELELERRLIDGRRLS